MSIESDPLHGKYMKKKWDTIKNPNGDNEMTKEELIEALNAHFEDDEVVVCACIDTGAWDNIECLGRTGGTATIFFGGGAPFSDE